MIAYYITAHGYGHGVRSCDIVRAVNRLSPETQVHIVSDLPVPFLHNRLGASQNHYRAGAFDAGMVQLDSVRVDVPASLRAIQAVLRQRPALLEQERGFLREHNVGLVVSDIPAIPLEAAAAEGIPALAVGNFSWDWIYEEFIPRDAAWQEVVDVFREGYRKADRLLRLPFAGPMEVFERQQQLPVLASPGRSQRERLAALCGAHPDKSWVLLSFSTLELGENALRELTADPDIEFFSILPLTWDRPRLHAVDREALGVADIIATVDLVLTKPGYGILSECVANQKPMLFVDREDFREYPVLEAAIQRHLQHQHLPAKELYAGHVAPYIHQALRDVPPPVEPLEADRADEAAQFILKHMYSI